MSSEPARRAITELVTVTDVGPRYVVEFDGGYVLEVLLPATTVLRFLSKDGRQPFEPPASEA